MTKTIVCFGETLWDVLPTGKQPGGAPFNVAVHLHQFSQPVALISRVGDDDLGAELLAFLAKLFGVPKRNVQLLSGHTAPFKKVAIAEVSDEAGAAVLARYCA